MWRNPVARKTIAVFLLLQFVSHIFLPAAFALTSGPSQPEFSSFEPVSNSNMVDEFTGDFTYNLPLLEVPGPHGGSYPVSLSYHSGVTPEEEASWVGYGWTLNAGAINRTVRGLPDDAKGESITNYSKTPANWTVTLGAAAFAEIFSKDPGMFSASINATYRYNNYRGFGLIKSAGLVLGRGLVNMGYAVDEGQGSFSLNVSPMSLLKKPVEKGEEKSEENREDSYAAGDAVKSFFRSKAQTTLSSLTNYNLGSKYGIFTYNQGSPMATHVSAYTGIAVNVAGAVNVTPTALEAGVGFNVMGSYSQQRNEPVSSVDAYGYLYSSLATQSHMMDYHTEKDNPYEKQDEFVGIPFNDADQFLATGEGIGGGFRLFHSSVGHFGPTQVSSSYDIVSITPELEAGLNWGGGAEVGKGNHSFGIKDWVSNRTTAKAVNDVFPNVEDPALDERAFFRFNNDPGGSWGELSKYDDRPVRFGINLSGGVSGNIDFSINNNARGGRSSYIGYHTNGQIAADVNKITRYSKRDWSFFVDRSQNPNKIGEIAVTNADGMDYVYGLPVYSKNERNLSFGLEKVSPTSIEKNYISYAKNESETKVGQERRSPYAYSYLLTEILSPDYLDKPDPLDSYKKNGPTPDDFGGYVRFGYHKIYGDQSQNGSWYKWRIPYNGVSFSRNSLSDSRDDMGTLASGQKEIYYLKTIETKSHVAIFYYSNRADGIGALDDDPAMTKNATSTDYLKQLDKIELFSLAALSTISRDAYGNIDPTTIPVTVQPVKRVHLKYAAAVDELMPGAPNAAAGRGRLTLQKVYFEYNGVQQAKISPYLFEYKYPTINYPGTAPANYSSFQNFGQTVRGKSYWGPAGCGMENPENPGYSPFSVDAWGNYQPFGCDQYQNMRTWIDQRYKPNIDFDPAPWQLKKITLPSGGEVHVQYEQDDYQYVQDQDAHVMVPLKTVAGETTSKFFVDLSRMGIDDLPDAPSKAAFRNTLKALITKRYINQNKKIYFKFLYTLKGVGTPALNSCNAEYITGYAKISAVGEDANGELYLQLGDTRIPKEVCKDFVYANVIGRVNQSTDCNRSADMLEHSNQSNEKSRALAMVQAFYGATISALAGTFDEVNYCQEINKSLSYFRLPTVNPKKGGGVRVKRLLMYDNSLEGPVLYGNTYDYTTTDETGRTISSGVATNEPAGNREENILVDYLPKKAFDWGNKIIAGKDKDVQEGPLGESVYPGPSVGYSKISVTNIFSGKTNPGFAVTEFYTAKDFPVKVAKTEIGGKSSIKFKLGIFSNKFVNNKTVVQGFSIVLNNMHGQMRRKATYSGDYATGIDISKSTLVSEQVLEYFLPGQNIPVMSGAYGAVTMKSLGREVDFTLAQRSITEANVDGSTEVDFTAGLFGIFVLPLFNFMGSITKTEALMNTHATTKVVRYPSMVKKVTTYQDGIYHTDEYAAFDELSGKPVAVKSEDEFKGAYLNQTIPAGWEYPNFTQSALSENKVVTATGGLVMRIFPPGFEQTTLRYLMTFTGTNACTQVTQFTPGDLVKLSGSGSFSYFHIDAVDYTGSGLYLVESALANGTTSVGSPTLVSQITVLESGRNNQLSQKAGSIVFHDPLKDNVDPQDFTDGSRYVTNTFTAALESGYEGAATSFVLAGPYTNMNMAAFSSYSLSCAADWNNASIRNLNFTKISGNNVKSLILTQFDIECTPGVWTTIKR